MKLNVCLPGKQKKADISGSRRSKQELYSDLPQYKGNSPLIAPRSLQRGLSASAVSLRGALTGMPDRRNIEIATKTS